MFRTRPTSHRYTENDLPLEGLGQKCEESYHGHLCKAALTKLEEQFGNMELVAGAFMNTVLDHPIVANRDIKQLRSFYNMLHNAAATGILS